MIGVVTAFGALQTVFPTALLAQQRPGQRPAAVRPGNPANPQGQRPGAAAPAAQGTRPGAAAPAAATQTEKPSAELPPGYKPPREIPPQFEIKDEWPVEDFRKLQGRYQQLIFRGEIKTDEERNLIRQGIRWRLAPMTLAENRSNLPALRNLLMSDLKRASSAAGAPMTARDEFLRILVEELDKLLSNHFVVRLNAAIILSELNSREEDSRTNQREVPLFTAARPLLKVLGDDTQPDAVRLWAVKGISRIAPAEGVPTDLRFQIIEALLEELRSSKTRTVWYQRRVAEGLGSAGAVEDRQRRPVVVQELAKVMVDPERHWLVRAVAARSIGRLPLENGINVSLLAVEVARLGQQMAQAYQQSPKQPFWRSAFWNLYLAFHWRDEVEKAQRIGLLEQVAQKSALSSHRKTVEEAYQNVVPLVSGVLNDQPTFVADKLKPLADWLGTNQPKDFRIAPTEEPIISNQPREEPNPQAG